MKFAVATDDFATVAAHAGHAARFVVFEGEPGQEPVETARVDLTQDQTGHYYQGGAHPLDGINVLIAGSAGQCFVEKMAARGIITAVAPGMAPDLAVAAYLTGVIGPLVEADTCQCSHDHDDGHDHGHHHH